MWISLENLKNGLNSFLIFNKHDELIMKHVNQLTGHLITHTLYSNFTNFSMIRSILNFTCPKITQVPFSFCSTEAVEYFNLFRQFLYVQSAEFNTKINCTVVLFFNLTN